ncbi:hypothetical protein C8Q76DRAFT_626022, partial [Earliella scabrosa]
MVTIGPERITLHSTECTGALAQASSCSSCALLKKNTHVIGIEDRIRTGIHENTPFHFLSFDASLELLRRKNAQLEDLRFSALNLARRYLVRGRTLDGYKRFVIAVAHSDLHTRVHKVVSVARKHSMSIQAIVTKLDQANRHLYSSRSYEEQDFQRSYLLWKLGGQRAADIAARSLGLPSLSTTRRHYDIPPIVPSAGFPTMDEIVENLQICLPLLGLTSATIMGYILQVDELKIEKRFRWDPRTNKILGICREHGGQCCLEFHSLEEIQVLGELLCGEKVHAATEATVIAVAAISEDHHEYAARPFIISGTCKTEDADAHATLLQNAVTATISRIASTGKKLYCVASDGETRRGKALGMLTMRYELETTSPLYSLLSPLPLFNRLVGQNELTCDKDWRHVLKRFRNALLRSTPLAINGASLTRPLIKRHLTAVDGLHMNGITADSLLSPNDPQDVVLAYKLLNSIASLPQAPDEATPVYRRVRQTLRLLGCIYSRLLRCYTDVTLTLREQLESLSAVSHMLLALYMQDKGGFIPAVLYLDAQIMIKNVYFCTAKVLVDRPDDGKLWIILLGTDALEKVFGLVRTMVGSDSNADQLQLASRVNGAVQCSRILQEHPEWDRGSRRLAIPSLQGNGDKIASSADHINPASWSGDVSVKNIVLQTCWYRGCQLAETDLMSFNVDRPQAQPPHSMGHVSDVLRPFG